MGDEIVVMGIYEHECALAGPVVDLGPLRPLIAPGDVAGSEDEPCTSVEG